MHQSFLSYRKFRWAYVALGLVVLSITAYALDRPLGDVRNGGTWLGYTLGTIGALLIVWLAWFGIRRRRYGGRRAPLVGWLSAHVWLGSTLILVVLLHSGFQFGWNVHALALVLTIAVVLSGFFGVFAYLRYPQLITDNRAALTRGAMLEEIDEIDREALALATSIDPKIHEIALRSIERAKIGGGVLAQLRARDETAVGLAKLRDAIAQRETTGKVQSTREMPTMFAMVDQLAASPEGGSAEKIGRLIDLFSRRKALARRISVDIQMQALLEIWLYIHVPLSLALVVCVTIHVLAVFFYW